MVHATKKEDDDLMYNNDPYDTGIPKYSTAQSVYDGLCELAQTEEMSILGEMFSDVSYENQDYYYTFHGNRLKEQFEEMTDWGNNLWVMDLAVWQIDQSEIHDLVWEALHNTEMAKRTGFKKLFVEHMLHGDRYQYDAVAEAYINELDELDRFDYYGMIQAFNRAMQACGKEVFDNPYSIFCHYFCEKVKNLRLQKETQLIAECRALLTSHDDFIFGLRSNQHLYNQLERQYENKVSQLQARYEEKVKLLTLAAERQGIVLTAAEDLIKLPEGDLHFKPAVVIQDGFLQDPGDEPDAD